MNTKTIVEKYMNDVLSGKELTGELIRLCFERHRSDLKQAKKKGWRFNETTAGHVIDFFQLLNHTKGRKSGQTFDLEPFQMARLWVLFGWQKRDLSGEWVRRFRTAYCEEARKNGKTAEAAAIALYMMIADGEFGSEVYTAATTKGQAAICWKQAADMVKTSPILKPEIEVLRSNLNWEKKLSKMEPLSRDSETQDGLNPHCAIVDEYHAHKTDEVMNVLESAMGARSEPLMFIITTAGFNRFSPCYKTRETAIDILKGFKNDDSMFVSIYSMDENDDWHDSNNWKKSNPGLDTIISREYLENEYHKAVNQPSKQVNFRTKNLNQWVDSSETWIPLTIWNDNNHGKNDLEFWRGRKVWAGLDLASTRDLSALIFFSDADENGTHHVKPFFFMPGDNVLDRVKNDSVRYDQWIETGEIIVTDGNVTDYNSIKQTLIEFSEVADIQTIGFDRWNASQIVQELNDLGFPMVPFGQGFASMSSPTKQLERWLYAGEINHEGNEVLEWMSQNVSLRRDPAGNIKIDKSKSGEKVDGMVGLVMAIGQYLTPIEDDEMSIYNERESFF